MAIVSADARMHARSVLGDTPLHGLMPELVKQMGSEWLAGLRIGRGDSAWMWMRTMHGTWAGMEKEWEVCIATHAGRHERKEERKKERKKTNR